MPTSSSISMEENEESLVSMRHNMCLKKSTSHAISNPPLCSYPNSSADLLSKALNTGWLKCLAWTTNRHRSSPTYTTRFPSGTSIGAESLLSESESLRSLTANRPDLPNAHPFLRVPPVLEGDFASLWWCMAWWFRFELEMLFCSLWRAFCILPETPLLGMVLLCWALRPRATRNSHSVE